MCITAGPLPLSAGALLVGFGTRLGGCCMGSHGICEIQRQSRPSITATGLFIPMAAVPYLLLISLRDEVMSLLIALLSGLLFSLGLTVLGMVNPAKVLGFLDLAGHWDPSLALVMAAAIPVAALGFAAGQRRQSALCTSAFAEPVKSRVETHLVAGAVLFGVGWGLVGFCPGPALASIGFGGRKVLVFVVAMLAGMAAFRLLERFVLTRPEKASSATQLT